ncbi:M1-specific T cell receptor alpha chain-like [Carassius carassius]|uniref:M1-specific T cell receptor alpha chain-like n=1 Tax=Carassius carassius TaxID=217509 RepID=UPI002868EB80|nr:M1-specific T cell receptor alpha chain-like [Carassius carassius]
MEKIMLFCVFSYLIVQITSSDASEHNVTLLRFQLNENITLNCNMTAVFHEIAWYHQNPESGRLTMLIFALAMGRIRELVSNRQNTRVTVKEDRSRNTVSLVMTGLMESDSGLYFCGTRSVNSDMHFEKPIRLQIEDREDKVQSVTDPPEEDENTDEVTLTERVLMFSGVALAVFLCFLVIIIAGRNIYCHGWRKGWIAAEHAGLNV